MMLIDTIQQVLETGLLPLSTERHLYHQLKLTHLTDVELQAIERLLEGLTNGSIQAIA